MKKADGSSAAFQEGVDFAATSVLQQCEILRRKEFKRIQFSLWFWVDAGVGIPIKLGRETSVPALLSRIRSQIEALHKRYPACPLSVIKLYTYAKGEGEKTIAESGVWHSAYPPETYMERLKDWEDSVKSNKLIMYYLRRHCANEGKRHNR